SFASRAGIKMMGSASVEVWQSVAADVENLRLALNWPFRALATETAQQHRAIDNQYLIIGALGDFWESRFRTEILQVFVAIVECDNERRPTRERASALSSAGFMEWSLHHFAEARRYLEESLAIAEQIGDQLMVAWALSHLGWNADFVGDYDAAQALGQRSLAIGRSLGDQGRYVVGQSLSFLGDIPYSRGDLLEARRLYEEAVVFLRDIKEVNRLTYPVRRLGYVSLHEGNISAALDCFSESLELNRQVGHLLGMVACIAGLAASHLEAGNLETSATLYTWVEAQLRRIGAPFFFIDTAEYQRGLLRLKQAIGPANLEQASAQARELALEDAIQLGQAR
ncbi:MAG TPA: tetratricopeptide repeat protein, partial [Anaerolineales bacterium]|nr:tetratricopeptide repeat protein [Anaerolineales bacterium]